ncbi:hypothetical protein [Tenacibaculum ovolyticum]|nr:hypothetical protein [Tenacibaculum ovolyticum]
MKLKTIQILENFKNGLEDVCEGSNWEDCESDIERIENINKSLEWLKSL